jgi:ferredoxin--NADP+ reductase
VSDPLGSPARPVRVAIIGAGPAGFYAAGALLNQRDLRIGVDLFERLPAPYGLVRYGVAPDHQKIKTVTRVFDRTASSAGFRFFGNVEFGRDLTRADLHRHYDAIIYAIGSQGDRQLGIPGEELAGSISSTAVVGWYNGHPDYTDLVVDLSGENAVVIGIGNVALDVARILASTPEELAPTDITPYAEEQLAASRIRDIYVLARRGPAQAKFTPPELKEFAELADADVVVDPAELELDPWSAAEVAQDAETRRNLDILRELAARPLRGCRRRVHFRFLVSPVALLGEDGHVQAVRVERNELKSDEQGGLVARGTGQFFELPAQLVVRAVGYRGMPLPDVPFDERHGIIPNNAGRVVEPASNQPTVGEYVVGWVKRGPTGVIGTNRPDAIESVESLLADTPSLTPAPDPDPTAVERLLSERGVQFVMLDGWRLIDAQEVARGQPLGKPRVKYTRVDEMLNLVHRAGRQSER